MIKDNNNSASICNNVKFLVKHVAYESVFATNGRYESELQHIVSGSSYCNYVVIVDINSKPPEVLLQCPEWHLMLVDDLENAVELAQSLVRCRVPGSVEEINDFFQHDFAAEFINGDNQEVILEMIRQEALEIARLDVESAWDNPVVKS